MDKLDLKKLKMHLQGAMDCLAQYEMAGKDEPSDDEDSEVPSASDTTADSGSDAGMKSLKMKMLSFKNKG